MNNPTMIRHKIVGSKIAVVITVLGSPFTARFQLYNIFENGNVGYDQSGGEWRAEKGAIAQYDKWIKENSK